MLAFDNKKVKVYNGDCVEILSKTNFSYDLIFADPPYHITNGYTTTCRSGKRVLLNIGEWDKDNGLDLNLAFHKEWVDECINHLTPNGKLAIIGTFQYIFSIRNIIPLNLNSVIGIYHPTAAPNLSCRRFTHSTEYILVFSSNSDSSYYPVIDDNGARSNYEKRYGKHPSPKSEFLMDWVVSNLSSSSDKILDPFLGSGTTAIASIKNYREFHGIELDSVYLNSIAIPRIIDQIKLSEFDK